MSDADGKWTLSFGADSTYEVSQNRKVVVTGIFTVVEDKLTIHDISGTRSCKAAQGDGTYRWTLEGKNLTLKGVSDGCVPRAGALSGSVWSMEQ